MASVSLDHISKRYRDVVAVRDLSLEIADGEFMALVGPSGCGKTTALRLVAGLEVPDAGTIRIDGRVVNDVPASARNVAMVFESYALYPNMAVRENLDFALRIHHTPAQEIRRRVSAVASSLDLGGLLDRRPSGLAAGEAQHVAIGRAIMHRAPAVLLLDDALSHLDARQRLDARAELGRVHREIGTTAIFVTHDQSEALAIATRIAVLDAGMLQQVGSPRTLYERPANVFVAGFIGTPPMNLFGMTLERTAGAADAAPGGSGALLRSGALALPIPDLLANQVAAEAGSTVTLGIRPEHVRLSAASADGEIPVRGACDLVEFMGHHVLVHLQVGDLGLRVLDNRSDHVRVGDVVDCTLPLDRLHLFDSRTGERLSGRLEYSAAG